MKLHSCFSIKYGVLYPKELVEWAKEASYSWAFLADINSTGAALSFIREAKSKGVRPIVGAEIRNGMHIVATVIARNNRGFHELNVFLSQYIQQEKHFPERLPHFSNCFVSYPITDSIIKLKSNE